MPNENIEYFETPPGLSIDDIFKVEEIEDGEAPYEEFFRDVAWEVALVDPYLVVFHPNVRAFSPEHIRHLAQSMDRTGQRQSCTADIITIDGEIKIRILAGQHRAMAARGTNLLREQRNDEPFLLRVRVADRNLTPEEILNVQITENLQNPMTPAEEAVSLFLLWEEFQKVRGEEASIAKLAEATGRGYDKVRNALKFMTLDSEIREAVTQGHLLYSTAVAISSLPSNKQIEISRRIILHNLDKEKMWMLIRRTLSEQQDFGALFSDNGWEIKEREDYLFAFKKVSDLAAKNASGYFKRIIWQLGKLEKPERAELTDTIEETLADFIYEAIIFMKILKEHNLEMAEKIDVRVSEMFS